MSNADFQAGGPIHSARASIVHRRIAMEDPAFFTINGSLLAMDVFWTADLAGNPECTLVGPQSL